MQPDKTEHGAATAAPLPERIATPLVWGAGVLSCILILTTLALTTYAVFMRYVVGSPLVWTDELNGYLLVACIFLGATEAYRRGNHIAIDLLTEKRGPFLTRLRWIWSDLCVLGFSVVLSLSTLEAIEFARMFGSFSSGEIEIETWIPQVPMLVGAILMGLFSVARLIGRFTGKGAA